MKSSYLFSSLIALLAMVSSCTTPQSALYPVSFHNDYTQASSILSRMECVKLATDTTDAVISDISRLLLAQRHLFAVDRRGNKIVSFDRKGNFLTSTLRLVGRGANEYLRIQDAAIDTAAERLYVYCDAPYQVMVLDYSLNVLECVRFDDLILECSVDEHRLYALCVDVRNTRQYELRSYDKSDLRRGYDVLLKYDKGVADVFVRGKSLSGDGCNTYVCMPFDSAIHTVSNGRVTDVYRLDFDNRWYDHATTGGLRGMQFTKRNEGLNWCLQNVCGSDSLLFFNTNISGIYEVKKADGVAVCHRNVVSDDYPFASSWLVPSGGDCNMMVFSIPAGAVRRFAEHYRSRGQNLPATKMNSIIEATQEADNPVIVMGKIL